MRSPDLDNALLEIMARDRAPVDETASPNFEPALRPLVPICFPKPDWNAELARAHAQEAGERERQAAARAQAELEPEPAPRPTKWRLP